MRDRPSALLPTTASTFGLKPGVSFCRVGGRAVFLDVSADRYFCLSPAGETAFRRLVDGAPLDDDHRAALDNLARAGPLALGPNLAPIINCPAVTPPSRSLLDDTAQPGMLDMLSATAALLAAPQRLRLCGLKRTLARIENRKGNRSAPLPVERLARTAAAFARLRLVATEKDNCLTRSIAIAGRLAALGGAPELIIAVKLQPFYAHAWVQCDGWLVNDRREFVDNYTPVLVV